MLLGFLFLVVSPAETSERYFQFCFPISPPLRSGAQVVQCCKYLHAAGSNPVLWKDLVFSQVSATSEETTFLFIFIKKSAQGLLALRPLSDFLAVRRFREVPKTCFSPSWPKLWSKVTKLDFSEADGLGKVQLEQICRLSLRGYLQVSYKSWSLLKLYKKNQSNPLPPASRPEWEKLHRGGLLPPGRCLLQVLTFHHWGDDQCQIYCCKVTRSYTADFIEIEWLDSGHWKYHTVSRFCSIGPDIIFVIPKIVYNNDVMWYKNICLLFWKL